MFHENNMISYLYEIRANVPQRNVINGKEDKDMSLGILDRKGTIFVFISQKYLISTVKEKAHVFKDNIQ